MTIQEIIHSQGFSVYFHGFGAIDSWLGGNFLLSKETGCQTHLLTNADTSALARLFENLRYPGIDMADAALDGMDGDKDRTWYFRCADSIQDYHPSFSLLEFYQDCKSQVFCDPRGIYPLLKNIRQKTANALTEILQESRNPNSEDNKTIMDAALILSKYADNIDKTRLAQTAKLLKTQNNADYPAGQEEQRMFLFALMNSANPGNGLELLKLSGFIDEFWPELAILD